MTTAQQFNIGDLVRFRNQEMIGPPMTVVETEHYQTPIVWCIWFDKNDAFHKQAFLCDQIEPCHNGARSTDNS